MARSIRPRNKLPKRYRLDSDNYALKSRHVERIIRLVRQSGVVEVLEAVVPHRSDAARRTSIRLVVVASLINAVRTNHKGQISLMTAVINNLPPTVLNWMGSPDWTDDGYDRVQRLVAKIAATLDEGPIYTDPATGQTFRVDHTWYTQTLLFASIPPELVRNCAISVDGTAMETWAALHTDPTAIVLDGDYRKDDPAAQAHQETAHKKSKKQKKRAKVLGVGPDGRNIYTKDPDARAGWRTATKSEPAGFYQGRELHLGVAVPSIAWTNRVDQLTFGPQVPQVILSAQLVPAGTHRTDTVIPALLELHDKGIINEVIADPGYTLAKKERFHLPLKQAGIALTMKPVTHQRVPSRLGGILLIDGQLFSAYTPGDLLTLPVPPIGATEKDKRPYVAAFERRARYRYSFHADVHGGAARYADPFRSGKLRSPQIPHTMRRNRSLPRITLPSNYDPELVNHTATIGADELPLEQPTIFGTTAWHRAIGRRNLAETANSQLKGKHVDIRRGYTQHLDSGRIKFHLAATLSIYNYNVMKNWYSHPDIPKERKPRKDRIARWDSLDLPTPIQPPGTSPPG